MQEPVLVINAGSSSIKFSGYAAMTGEEPKLLFKGQIEGIGSAPHLAAKDSRGAVIADEHWPAALDRDHADFFDVLLDWLEEHLDGNQPAGVGHRVVHGGTAFISATRIDDQVLLELQALCPLAPLHQPHSIAGMHAIAALAPSLPQVACFDTAFHHGQPDVAQRFGLPRELHEHGVRRYGFHGLSYDYIASALRTRAPDIASGRVIAAHLGSGASLCAMLNGKSIDTTMGFTALDGLPMGTRCGALDPGAILYLLRERGMNADAVEDLLYHRSGLLGVSGLSNDMRVLLASRDPRAEEAVELFVYRVSREFGALAASLGGLDGLVFTGGIGEHAPEIRARVCERSRWLGINLDARSNERGDECVSARGSRVPVWVLPTDEELTIARQTIALLKIGGKTQRPAADVRASDEMSLETRA